VDDPVEEAKELLGTVGDFRGDDEPTVFYSLKQGCDFAMRGPRVMRDLLFAYEKLKEELDDENEQEQDE
jgi:hypothetical protein